MEQGLTEKQRRLFGSMERASQRMQTLIDDLLEYSHISRGVSSLEEVDLTKKVENVLEDLELEIAQKGAIIEADPLPVIRAHKRQIQQLFQNLIGNALKYHKKEVPPHIRIRCAIVKGSEVKAQVNPEEGNKNFYWIAVSDNGIGFDPKDAERIFNVFTRLHGNTEYSGSGVGLSIARKVMENHKGYISAESGPGEGATFNIYFPADRGL
jgi:signal transduction histidine kinase